MIVRYEAYNRVLFRRSVHTRIDDGAGITFVEQDVSIFLVGVVFKGSDAGHKPKIQN